MKIRDFRIGIRLLLKEANHTILVLLGLALGFAVAFLLAAFVRQSFNYDEQVPDSDHVYFVKTHFNFPGTNNFWSDTTPFVIKDVLAQTGMTTEVSRFLRQDVSVRAEGKVLALPLTLVDPSFAAMMNVTVLEGSLAQVLERPDALALTASTASAMFAGGQALGKTVVIDDKAFQIAAVIADPPQATTMPYKALAGIESAVWGDQAKQVVLSRWTEVEGKIFVRLKAGAAPSTLAHQLELAANSSPLRNAYPPESVQQLGANNGNLLDIRLGALSAAYFDPDIAALADPTVHGDRNIVLGLAAVVGLILLLASTNYVSLATVRTMRRQREIGVLKVLGATARQIMWQFIFESVCFSIVAGLLGALLSLLALPVVCELINRKLEGVFAPVQCLLALLVALGVGALAGCYPAWLAMRVPARQLVGRGYGESLGGNWLRRLLTVLQFSTAIALIGLTLAIAWQTQYATRLNPGFDPAPLLVLRLPGDMTVAEDVAFAEAVKRLPGVSGVAATTGVIGQNKAVQLANVQHDPNPASIARFTGVSTNFFDVFGIRPIAGRVFNEKIDPKDKAKMVVISKSAVALLGYTSPQSAVGQFILFGRLKAPTQIIGVVDEVRHETARNAIQPMFYVPWLRTSVLTARINQDSAQVQSEIEQLWLRSFPNNAIELDSLKARIERNYADDRRLSWLLIAATIIIGAISSLGIYVLSAYTLQQRVKEIAVRKLYGADRFAVARLVGREAVLMVLVSALLGLPVAALVSSKYLANFVERAPVLFPSLVIAFLLSALVACLSTARSTLAATRVAPALALRE